MPTFNDLWQLLYDNGSSNYYKHDCYMLWNELDQQQQQRLYNNILQKLQNGKYVDFNPLAAMHDNKPRRVQPRTDTLSYDEYYRTFRTTLPKDGWQMRKDANGKVFYAKQQIETSN